MSVHLKIENRRDGFVATLSQRDDAGKVIGHPSVEPVASANEARQLAKTLAQSLGLKAYGVLDKTKSAARAARSTDADPNAAQGDRPPWRVTGVGRSI